MGKAEQAFHREGQGAKAAEALISGCSREREESSNL